MKPARRLLATAAALLVLVGCARATPPDGRLEELASVDAFARRFDEARGKPRLLLLLSPT